MMLFCLALLAVVPVALSSGSDCSKSRRPSYSPPNCSSTTKVPKIHPPSGNKVLGSWAKYTGGPSCPDKRNFIFMVSDGFGTASQTIAREFYQYKTMGNDKLAIDDLDSILPLDELLVGSVRTKSSSSWVTDSASAATAMATGHKTYNAGVGVNENYEPVATVLEAAKLKGFKTALVATSRITHATPASWSSHVGDRDEEELIALQQIGNNPLGRSIDLMLGGGRAYFQPKSVKGSYRKDERDLLKEAQEKHGWNKIIETRKELMELQKSKTVLPLIGLFAQDHIDYEIDRNPNEQPSLSEMTDAALAILADATKDCSSPGFFIMIEGSRIDQAAHSNDAPTHIHEILEYQHAVNIVKTFVKMNPNSRAISVSDHETGAVSKAWQVDRMVDQMEGSYIWYPQQISPVKMSIEKLAPQILNYQGHDLKRFIHKLIRDQWGIDNLTPDEIAEIIQGRDDQNAKRYPGYVFPIEVALSKVTSKRALVGWNTNGHSGMDVNLYGINVPDLRGNKDNTYLAWYSAESLGYGIWKEMNNLKKKLASIQVNRPLLTKRSLTHHHPRH